MIVGAIHGSFGLRPNRLTPSAWVSADSYELLSQVLATEDPRQRLRRLLKAVHDVLAIPKSSLPQPLAQLGDASRKAVEMVENQKGLHSRPGDEELALDAWSRGHGVGAYRPADDDPAAHVELVQDGVQHVAANIVEEHIDAGRAVSRSEADKSGTER